MVKDNEIPEESEEVIESSEETIEGSEKDKSIAQNNNIGSADSPLEELDQEEEVEVNLKDYYKNQIEASLYVAGRPLSIEELSTKLEISKKDTEKLVNEIAFDYLERSTAIVINRVGEKYQMGIKPEYVEKVSKFAKGGAIAEKYLRTLTIIALKQPILKSLLVKIRGSGAYEHVKYLLDQEFVSAVKKGRSFELTTTEKYAEMFGLPKNIEEMKRVMVEQLGLDEEKKPKSEE